MDYNLEIPAEVIKRALNLALTALQPVAGKGLSTNDFTDEAKNALAQLVIKSVLWDAKYTRPEGGIPAADIAPGVIPDIQPLETKLAQIVAKAVIWDAKYTKPENGIPAADIANGVIPDVSQFITKDVQTLTYFYDKDSIDALLESLSSEIEAIIRRTAEWDAKYTKPEGGIPASDLANGVIPDVSSFITKTVDDLVNYFTKTEVTALIGQIKTVRFEVVGILPTVGESNVIYLRPAERSAEKNIYDEFIYVSGAWEQIGTTAIDLSGYAKKEDVESVQNVVNDLSYGLYNDDETEGELGDIVKINAAIEGVKADIEQIRLFKYPNATIVGALAVDHGQVSGFAKENYMVLPFRFEPAGKRFEMNLAFITGADVMTPQNVLGSKYSIAVFVANGRLNVRVSSNGTDWNIIDFTYDSLTIQPNHPYYLTLAYDGINYSVKFSDNGKDYATILNKGSNQWPASGLLYLGVGNNFNNPFGGIINLNRCEILFDGQHFWEGMDDAGLSTRLATDMSNLDPDGEQKVKDIAEIASKVFVAKFNETSGAEIIEAFESGKAIFVLAHAINSSMCVGWCTGHYYWGDNNQYFNCNFTYINNAGYTLDISMTYYVERGDTVWSWRSKELQSVSDRQTVIPATPDDTHYPTSKAVADYVDAKNNIFIAEYGVTPYQDVLDAFNAGKALFVRMFYDTVNASIMSLGGYWQDSGKLNFKFYCYSKDIAGFMGVYIMSNGVWGRYSNTSFQDASYRQTTITDSDTNYPTSAAVVRYAAKKEELTELSLKVGKLETAIVKDLESTSKTIEAVAKTNYIFGVLESLAVTFPASGNDGEMIDILCKSGETAMTLVVDGNWKGENFAPSANSVVEINAVWYAVEGKWMVLFNEIAL